MVSIASRLDGSQLCLTVCDNGVGLSGGARASLHDGVGLSNTRKRLECLYGAAHALDFVESGQGLTVEMRLPFHRVSSGSDETATRVA